MLHFEVLLVGRSRSTDDAERTLLVVISRSLTLLRASSPGRRAIDLDKVSLFLALSRFLLNVAHHASSFVIMLLLAFLTHASSFA